MVLRLVGTELDRVLEFFDGLRRVSVGAVEHGEVVVDGRRVGIPINCGFHVLDRLGHLSPSIVELAFLHLAARLVGVELQHANEVFPGGGFQIDGLP